MILERAEDGALLATPFIVKSNLIFGLVRAHGLVCAPMGVNELRAGEMVDVRLFA